MKAGLLTALTLAGGSAAAQSHSIFDVMTQLFGDGTRAAVAPLTRAPRPAVTAAQRGDASQSIVVPPHGGRTFKKYPPPACVRVKNDHASGLALMVPNKSREEWRSFSQHLPPGVSLRPCYCERNLTLTEVEFAMRDMLGIDIPRQKEYEPPVAPYVPVYSARWSTVNKICEDLGCGPPAYVGHYRFNDPADDAILIYTGVAWQKVGAWLDNYKLDHRSPTLRCGP